MGIISLHTQPMLNVMFTLIKHPTIKNQFPDTAFLARWLTVWVLKSEIWIPRVTALSWWFDFGLVTIHPWTPNVKMGSE